MSQPPFRQRVKVQPFPEGLEWINTATPLQPNDLRGKFVLLDFWTYCCINCMHVLPELKKLEKAYPRELVVIGVHSAKFEGEKETQNITEAVLRYNVEHPVVNDSALVIWRRFAIRAWPTLLLIDPEGYAVWANSGETTFDELDAVMKKAVPYYRKKGLLVERPTEYELEAEKAEPTPLRFPGKILADPTDGRLFIADSNHNRIVVTRLDGSLLRTIGAGTIGRADGDYATAQFQQPQGMALDGQTLYVADTENHLVRKVDLAKRRVTTVAGLGRQARQAPPPGSLAKPLRTALSSPWALWIHKGDLYIAMAGLHQIWKMRLDGSGIGVYAGNGREDIVDGPLLPGRSFRIGSSSFAQPSGLASDGRWLYVADSEGSSIRAVALDPRREVKTVVGTAHLPAGRLFTFGDVDGRGRPVRLQHPLGVVYYEGKLYVADTYNNKIKVIDPGDGSTRTLAGSGRQGRSTPPPTFDEPAGITAADGKLFVADTNNHTIRVIDLGHRSAGEVGDGKVSTLSIPGLEPPEAVRPPVVSAP
ncbi:MAG: thioredoxin-like domain-containing protein [Planctomycetota bacterium]|jgi:DNA-binding beta-propeller fold protein YncE